MKKALHICVVLMVSLAFAGMAFGAANTVQTTLTSPTITKSGCEKVGSVTFAFQGGSDIDVGDWWYMDLPTNVTLCRGTINYLIVGGNGSMVTLDPLLNGNAAFASNTTLLGRISNGFGVLRADTTDMGPVTASLSGAATDGLNAAYRTSTTNMAFRVYGAQNSRRVLLTAVGQAGGSITVGSNWDLKIKIFDGKRWTSHGAGVDTSNSQIVLDSNNNLRYNETGDTPNELILASAGAEPVAANTLCVDAEDMAGDLMFTSFDSSSSKFTFTGDSQIAHTASANAITLDYCKGVITGNIQFGQQGACALSYEDATGYCTADTFATQTMEWGTAGGGNKAVIKGASLLGENGDSFEVYMYIDTPGVYFTAAPAYLDAYLSSTLDYCSVALAGGADIAPAWTAYNEGGTSGATYAGTNCTVAAANRVREIRSAAFTGVHLYDSLELDVPAMSYDTSIVGNSTAVSFRVSFRKYPCGEIASLTRTLGTFVSTCPAASGTSTLLFPFIPALDGSSPGWWGGFLIINGSSTAGTAALTVYEADGDTATYTTPSIAAHGQFNPGSMASFLALLVPAAGNAGTVGDSNLSVSAACNFSSAAGFAFTGNGEEGTGYIAYTDNTGWGD